MGDRTDTNNPDESYSYDANGNRVSSSIHGEGYKTGDGNRLLSDGTFNYEYDNEGNLIRRTEIATGVVRELEWDYRNRLVAAIDKDAAGNETQRVEYTYDVFDRRIAKAVENLKVPLITPQYLIINLTLYRACNLSFSCSIQALLFAARGPPPIAIDLTFFRACNLSLCSFLNKPYLLLRYPPEGTRYSHYPRDIGE